MPELHVHTSGLSALYEHPDELRRHMHDDHGVDNPDPRIPVDQWVTAHKVAHRVQERVMSR